MTRDTGPKTAEQVIRNLHNFNRKERDHLMKFALSESPSHPQISKDLWRAIRPDSGKRQRPSPTDMFVGMDYHLNWLYAALVLSAQYEEGGIDSQPNKWPEAHRGKSKSSAGPIQGNQEDVDLLVAFPGKDNILHLVLVEAKLGSGWNSGQFRSKVDRLKAIRRVTESDSYTGPIVDWRFSLASPRINPPSAGEFEESLLPDPPSWLSVETRDGVAPRYFRFGPKELFQVKRRSAKETTWQVRRVNLLGRE
jgi:hypothetical protein